MWYIKFLKTNGLLSEKEYQWHKQELISQDMALLEETEEEKKGAGGKIEEIVLDLTLNKTIKWNKQDEFTYRTGGIKGLTIDISYGGSGCYALTVLNGERIVWEATTEIRTHTNFCICRQLWLLARNSAHENYVVGKLSAYASKVKAK